MFFGFTAILLFGFQAYQWHAHGVWPNITLLWVLGFIPYAGLQNWISNPTSLQQLHDSLSFIQVWALLFFLALVSMIKRVTK